MSRPHPKGINRFLLKVANGMLDTVEMLIRDFTSTKRSRRGYRKSVVQHSYYRGSRWTKYRQKPIVIVIERERP